jgi:hypothetical protein
MSISVKLTSAERRERTEQLLEEHRWKFDTLKEIEPLFIPKSAYIPRGKNEHYISFFPSELARKQDIYTEFVSYDLVPEDPERTLYKLKANPFYDEEYEKTDDANFRYLVPVKELEKIVISNPEVDEDFSELDEIITFKKPETKPEINLSDDLSEIPLSEISVRDFAAIMLRKPISNKEWLNKLIKD